MSSGSLDLDAPVLLLRGDDPVLLADTVVDLIDALVGDGDRSMVTVDPGVRASAADVAALEPRAVALSLDQLYCVPPGAAAYVTCGDDDARAFARRPPAKLAGAPSTCQVS